MATKENKNIICENCDSEYSLKYSKVMVGSAPKYCAFCGEEVESSEDEVYEVVEGEDFHEDNEDY
jgi:hypothetical protein